MPSLPRLNEPAPDFKANTTQGMRTLADYRGRWLVLFSHPGDFTPVCTSEAIAFAEHADAFKALNCELLSVSVDSVYSHLAWVRNIREKFGVDVPFPIADDVSMRISHDYGMIQPSAGLTETVRATFIIDGNATLRSLTLYPPEVGRSILETLRLVHALQAADRERVGTPADWQPGAPVLAPPPATAEEAEQRLLERYNCADWYYCERPSKETPQAQEGEPVSQ